MSRAGDFLSQVWTEFRKVGIADDLTIIENIAAHLLEIIDVANLDERLKPQKTTQPVDTIKVQAQLTKAIQAVGGAEKLFDHHVLFRLLSRLPGGRYPTPRHLVEFIIHVAQVEPAHRLGDFACGSAGLLANHDRARNGLTLGIEISPEWARLAYTNLRLHNLPPDKVQVDPFNALTIVEFLPEKSNSFDRILMNPPFGETFDAKLAENIVGFPVGSRSETIFTALALKYLAPKGTAAILLPSGFLFGNSSGERTLRQNLVNDNQVEAIISFPKDALRPYSSLQTHLLLFHKDSPRPNHLIWFLHAQQDGYPTGRSRNLAEPPPNPSDLPTIEQVLLGSVKIPSGFDIFLPERNPQVGIKKIWVNNCLSAISIHGISADLTSISLAPPPKPKKGEKADPSPLLNIEVATEPRISLSTRLHDIHPLELTISSNLLFLSQPVKIAVIALPLERLTDPVRLLGVAVQSSVIQQQTYDLHPEQYIGKQQESRSSDSPAVILGRIYRSQRSLAQRIDRLFGHLEMPPIATLELPSPLLGDEPFGQLSQEQQKIWEKIKEETNKTNNNGETSLYFTAESVSLTSTDEVTILTRQTLDLFERMGVLVPVTVLDQTNQPQFLYRCVAERDRWQEFDLEQSGSKEGST